MKIFKQLFTLAAIALLMTACNKNEEFAPETNSTFPADGIIRVATSVKNPQTRAGMTTEDLQEFQLHIVNEENAAYSYTALMKKSGKEWGSFELDTDIHDNLIPMTLLWQNKTQPVKVAAVASGFFSMGVQWNENCTISVSSFQDTEIEMKKSDILYMAETEINPATDLVDGKIQVALKHRLSKLNLTVNMGTEFNKLEGGTTSNIITDMEVENTSTKAFWDILEDDMFTDPSVITSITPWHNSAAYTPGEGDTTQAEAKYECILIPQTVDADRFTVSFTIGDRFFSWWSPTEVVLAADTQYNLTLNVGKDVVTVAGFTATPWTEADEQSLGTE